MVIGIAQGAVTVEDLDHFVGELGRAQAYRYRKLLDFMFATWAVSDEEMVAFSQRVRSTPRERASGPVALVTLEINSPLERIFVGLTGGKRPVKVFASIHAARLWLRENSLVEY
ncbi:MAG TPA: hypothetical protein VMI56_21410 [Reyranella sp.]|nr:hypothetical protein [Reyranella sp.]